MSVVQERAVTYVPVAMPFGGSPSHSVEAACLALRTLSEYAVMTGRSANAPVRELVVDLLADLMHLADQSGFSFEAASSEAACAAELDVRRDALDGAVA